MIDWKNWNEIMDQLQDDFESGKNGESGIDDARNLLASTSAFLSDVASNGNEEELAQAIHAATPIAMLIGYHYDGE